MLSITARPNGRSVVVTRACDLRHTTLVPSYLQGRSAQVCVIKVLPLGRVVKVHDVLLQLCEHRQSSPPMTLDLVWRPSQFFATAHLVEDNVGGSLPDERLRRIVPTGKPAIDCAFQFFH